MSDNGKKPIVVVAGQVPPPTGGQNVMIQRIVDELAGDERWHTVHLPFYFTPSFQTVRRFRFAKITELVAVWWRFLRIVQRFGRPDLIVYPSGGPQTIPVVRDILLLPFLCFLSKRVVVQFHAAGVAERLRESRGAIERLLRFAYRQVGSAIVMTDFNRRDPLSLGVAKVDVVPHRLADENPERTLPGDPSSGIRILYAGHLYDQKGTPQLIESFGAIAREFPTARLALMGEFLPPYTEQACRTRCRELGIASQVEILGVLAGNKKAAQFRAAHVFVFPSVAPYESFGLVIAEALMYGLPLVVTDWRGNGEVAGPDAYVCPVSNPALLPELASVLKAALSDLDGLRQRSEKSRARFEEFFLLQPGTADYRDLVRRHLSA